jgi:MFS family permease
MVPIAGSAAIAVTSLPAVAALAFAAYSFTAVTWNVVTVSLRQVLIPDPLLGRVNSVYRFFGWGMMPIGTLLGGWLVWFVEATATRELALRAPFIAAVLIHLVLLVTVSPRLTQRALDDAREAAARTSH